METILQLVSDLSTRIVLLFLKSILNTLLAYPVNIAIMTVVVVIIVVKFTRGMFENYKVGKDWKKIKS